MPKRESGKIMMDHQVYIYTSIFFCNFTKRKLLKENIKFIFVLCFIGPQLSARDKEFTGKVVEIVNGDAIMVKKNKTETKKIFLASMKPPPRPEGLDNKIKPLYDIPFMFEAREFLRKKLIGQNVHVIVDYVQPVSTDELSGRAYPEKICGTITIGGKDLETRISSRHVIDIFLKSSDRSEHSILHT